MFSNRAPHFSRAAGFSLRPPRRLARAAALLSMLALLLSCENHKDPFSAKNSVPVISAFAFKPDLTLPDAILRAKSDSLKFRVGTAYPITLTYEDAESKAGNRNVRALFKFVSGSGRITGSRFSNPSADGLEFDTPPAFDGEIFLTPTNAGVVELQLRIMDGVKNSETKIAATTFFTNLPPRVRFTAQPGNQNNPPYGVTFNAAASVDRDGQIDTYTWSFGDSEARTTTRSNSIHHDYQRSGSFTVRLRITDDEGAADSLDQVVTTFNMPPVAALSVTPTSGKAPLTIRYNARGSRDPDGTIAAYDVAFGDGESSQADSGSHTYTRDANYNVVLTVRDNVGASHATTVAVAVATPPIAVLQVSPDSGAFPLSVLINGAGSYDPLGGSLSSPRIFINDQATYDQLTVTHVFRQPGDYRVALQVTNDRGLNGRVEKVVRATNTPPVADFTWVRDLGNVTFTSRSYDPNAPDDRITNYIWNFGDETPEQSGSNLSNILHTYGRSGTYVVQLTVTDSFNISSVKKDTVEVR